MEICILSAIFPPDIGGPATSVPRLAELLRANGYTVRVIAVSGRRMQTTYSFPVKIVLRKLWLPIRYMYIVYLLLTFGRTARIIYCNNLEIPTLLGQLLKRRRIVTKIVGDTLWERLTLSERIKDTIDDFQDKRYDRFVELAKKFRNKLIRYFDAVVVPSNYLRNLVFKWGIPDEKIHVIPNFVEFHEMDECPNGKRHDGFVIITGGRLVPWKGIETLIELVGLYPDQYQLKIFGDGPLRKKLERISIERGLERVVTFLGSIGHEDMKFHFRHSDLFILNSFYEGLPHVILEAMAMGINVMVSRCGGNTEVVSDGVSGFLFEPGNVGQIKERLEILRTNRPLMDEMKKNGYLVVKKFNKDDTFRKFQKLFSELDRFTG